MHVAYTRPFLRNLKRLPPDIQEQAMHAVEALQREEDHARLRIHKLQGRLAGLHACSVNFRYRILFLHQKPDTALLLNIGDHRIYDR